MGLRPAHEPYYFKNVILKVKLIKIFLLSPLSVKIKIKIMALINQEQAINKIQNTKGFDKPGASND